MSLTVPQFLRIYSRPRGVEENEGREERREAEHPIPSLPPPCVSRKFWKRVKETSPREGYCVSNKIEEGREGSIERL
jgi:hypothetical protein